MKYISQKKWEKLPLFEQAVYNATVTLQHMVNVASRDRKYIDRGGYLRNSIVYKKFGERYINSFENYYLKQCELTYEQKCEIMKIFTRHHSFFQSFNKDLMPFNIQFK